MSARKFGSFRLLSFLLGMILVILILAFATPVQAEETPPPSGEGCKSCHENLYYLHDTGNWLCQCAQQMTCTCCHGGNPDVYKEDEAHAGMNLYPTRNDAIACQNCHPDDYATRIENFASLAGISPVHPPIPTPTSLANFVDTSFNNQSLSGRIMRALEPSRQIGLLLMGIVLIVLFFLGFYCWRSDCLEKGQN